MTPLDYAFVCFWVIFLLSAEKMWKTRLLQTWGCSLDSKGKPCPWGHRAVGLAVKPDDHHIARSKELLVEYASSRVTTHSDIKLSIFSIDFTIFKPNLDIQCTLRFLFRSKIFDNLFKICKNDKFTLFQKYQIKYLYKYFQNG